MAKVDNDSLIQSTAFPWLMQDFAFNFRKSDPEITIAAKKAMKLYHYRRGSFNFRNHLDSPGSTSNQTWLEGSGSDDLKNDSTDTKEAWDVFRKNLSNIISNIATELTKFYKKVDGQNISVHELNYIVCDFFNAFPLIEEKYYDFKRNCCSEKKFKVSKTTFYDDSVVSKCL